MNAPTTNNRRAITLQTANKLAGVRFAFGHCDCCLFAARIAEAITGIDYSAAFEYADEADAERLIAEAGGLSGLLTSILGDPVGVEALDYGDPCLVNVGDRFEFVGVWFGDKALSKSETSLVLGIRAEFVRHGWKV